MPAVWYVFISSLAPDEYSSSVGPIARIAPNHLITSDLDFWTRINAVRSPYKRSSWYYHAARFEPGKDNVFTECDNDRHDARRKKMVAGVSQFLFETETVQLTLHSTLARKTPR